MAKDAKRSGDPPAVAGGVSQGNNIVHVALYGIPLSPGVRDAPLSDGVLLEALGQAERLKVLAGAVAPRVETDTPKRAKVCRLTPAVKSAADAFKRERDAGSGIILHDFCIEYAEQYGGHKASYLERKLNRTRDQWDPEGKYGRPQTDT